MKDQPKRPPEADRALLLSVVAILLLILGCFFFFGYIPEVFRDVDAPDLPGYSSSPIEATVISILLSIFGFLLLGLLFQVFNVKSNLEAEKRELTWANIIPFGLVKPRAAVKPLATPSKGLQAFLDGSDVKTILDEWADQLSARESAISAKAGHEVGQRPIRRALVLAGGGAKGAYQFGCLKALKDKRFEFAVVSGTSVGALNGIIWSTGAFEEGQRLWDNISYSNVYPVKMLSAARHKDWVVRAATIGYVLLALIWSTLRGIPTPGRPWWNACLALVSIILWPLFALIGCGEAWFLWCISLSPIFFLFLKGRQASRLGFPFMLLVLFWCIGLAIFLDTISPFPNGSLLHHPIVSMVGGAALTFLSLGLVFKVLTHFFSDELGFLSQSGLSESIREVLKHPLKIPAFATLSLDQMMWDPDNPEWNEESSGTFASVDGTNYYIPESNPMQSPDTTVDWIPYYAFLNRLPVELREKACLASAALPFGVVPSVRIGKYSYKDGGVADNVPYFPMLNHQAIDEIFILLLEPVESCEAYVEKVLDAELWSKLDRKMRLARLDKPARTLANSAQYDRTYSPPRLVPFNELTYCPKVFLIAPPNLLGRGFMPGFLREFVGGTLRFESNYASDLMSKGYSDTLALLSEKRKDSADHQVCRSE